MEKKFTVPTVQYELPESPTIGIWMGNFLQTLHEQKKGSWESPEKNHRCFLFRSSTCVEKLLVNPRSAGIRSLERACC